MRLFNQRVNGNGGQSPFLSFLSFLTGSEQHPARALRMSSISHI